MCVAISDSLPLTGVLSCVLTAQYRPGEHTLRGSHQYLGHYGRCGYSLDTVLSCVMVCSECIQLVTEDAVNKKRCGHEERQQEWTDVKLQYLLQLRHSIVTCVCIHMMRDEESSESHDKVPTLLTL